MSNREPRKINFQDLPWSSYDVAPGIGGALRDVGRGLGSRRLGLRIQRVPPGNRASRPHRHVFQEELLVVMSGKGVLLHGDRRIEVSQGDCISYLPSDEGSHTFENPGPGDLEIWAFGDRLEHEVVFYPEDGVAFVEALGGDVPLRISVPARGEDRVSAVPPVPSSKPPSSPRSPAAPTPRAIPTPRPSEPRSSSPPNDSQPGSERGPNSSRRPSGEMEAVATHRARARVLAAASIAAGDPTGWFERLYTEARSVGTTIPWADMRPNPHLCEWLDRASLPGRGMRALDVGCGFGDNAGELARRGFAVTAFDIAPTAVAKARERFADAKITFLAADVLNPPSSRWRAAFDLVVEVYTLQSLPPTERQRAIEILRALVAPGGTLLVITRARDEHESPGEVPWPLTRAEVEKIAQDDLRMTSFEDFVDGESPPIRRFRATFVRPER